MTNPATISFDDWKEQVDRIAERHGLEPMENPPPHEVATWWVHYGNGLTPQQAWDATPWKRRW